MEFTFVFPLREGLHARPAAALRERALAHPVEIAWINERTGLRASLQNVLSLLATDTHHGDSCRLEAEGPEADQALEDLSSYLTGPFLACDGPKAGSDPTPSGISAPRILQHSELRWWQGRPLSAGIGEGEAVYWWGSIPDSDSGICGAPLEEQAALRRALRALSRRIGEEAAEASHPTLRAVLEVHAAILQDGEWLALMDAGILAEHRSAAAAVREATRRFSERLLCSENAYLRARALDLQGLADRLLGELQGDPSLKGLLLVAPSVLLAESLTPSAFLSLDRNRLRGIVLGEGSESSHTAILARSFGVPCVAGIPEIFGSGPIKGKLLVDGRRGLVVSEPSPLLRAYYQIEVEAGRERQRRVATQASLPVRTLDGRKMEVLANVGTPEEAERAFQEGADGIGLFRSELLFMDRASAPSEEEQAAAYTRLLDAAGGRPVVLRLLDIGGDKPLPYLPLPAEANPFLGFRAVRWYPTHEALLRTQLRAALRAGRYGDLRLLIPMVTEREEVQWLRQRLEEAALALRAEGIPAAPSLPLGIMVETPAAALNLSALARVADFLSVGTNDLVQYLFAADRGNPRVAKASHAWHPATLRILDRVVRDALSAGCPISLCGEVAGRRDLLPLLVGLGFERFSVAPSRVAEIKAALGTLHASEASALAQHACLEASSEEVSLLLERHQSGAQAPLLVPELVITQGEIHTKDEALKALAERLQTADRAEDAGAVEAALWAREELNPTGMGHGFAVPHCKSAQVKAPSMALMRLRNPIAWGSLDGQPVDFVILLATGTGDGENTHLRVFARLARRLMDEAFRDALRQLESPDELIRFLETEGLVAP